MILNLLERLLGVIDLVILNLTLKIVQERRLFQNLFSQGNGVGLRLYTDYVISKNSYDWCHQVVTCFVLKMEFFWKSDKERRTCDFDNFVEVGQWNAHVYSTALICDLSVYIVEALDLV